MQQERSSTPGSNDPATHEAAQLLVSLITNQDQVTKTWVQFLITVEEYSPHHSLGKLLCLILQ